MEYQIIEEKFKQYINKCREMIKNTFFKEEDLNELKLNTSIGLDETIRKHRLHMIDVKLDHTMRMIEQIIKINEKLDLKFDFRLVLKIAILYHDIGRFSQATWSNTYNDQIYQIKNKPFKHHGEEGKNIFINNDFGVDSQYIPIIGTSIKHHVDVHKEKKLQYRYNHNIRNINVKDIITGKLELNDTEYQVASLITQLVADIDKADILYQHLNEDFGMIKDYVYDYSNDTLDNIAKKWKLDKLEIIEYNEIEEAKYIPQTIKIPIKNVEISKLEVPKYIKDMFYTNNWLDLEELKKDPNWNFITILWWRISHFLNNINFYSVLATIEETKLLEEIEKKIPNKLKPLVKEAFEYAEETLINRVCNQNKNNIYIYKK